MKQDRLLKVLVGPVVSEKSTMVADKANQYTFAVVPDATKAEVKAAVELCACFVNFASRWASKACRW